MKFRWFRFRLTGVMCDDTRLLLRVTLGSLELLAADLRAPIAP